MVSHRVAFTALCAVLFASLACKKNDAPSDAGASTETRATSDAGAGDVACPNDWTSAPSVDPSLLPDAGDAGSVVLHARGIGTQNYVCTATTGDAGPAYAWVFVGPEAELDDCHAIKIGAHFASDAGATAPEWTTSDGTFVVGKKVRAFTPDAGSGAAPAAPWLLLAATSHGGAGALAKTEIVQRLSTTGGVAPTATCDSKNVGATTKVPYTAEYWFYGAP